MIVNFHNVTVCVEAATPKDAYTKLCEILTNTDYVTDSYSIDDDVLDGKPEPDHRTGTYRLLNDTTRGQAWPRETECHYLHFRCFKNGNGHITFKRPDLVEKMNAILTKHFPGALAWDHHA